MVLGLFKATLIPDTCLRVMPKNSPFSCFMVIFMSYCPHFLGSSGFACLERSLTCLKVMPRNSPFSRFMAVFMSYCPQFLGFSRICMSRKNPDMFERYDQKLDVLAFYGRFHKLVTTV